MGRDQTGYTLVELLITIIVIGVVFAGLSSIFISIQHDQVHTSYLETATRAAQKEVESLRNNSYSSLVAGQDINFSGDLQGSLPAGATGVVHVSEPVSGLKRVDVQIDYEYGGRSRQVAVSSLIGILGITQ